MSFTCISISYFLVQFEIFAPKWNWIRITLSSIGAVCGVSCDFNPQRIPIRIFIIFCLYANTVFSITVLAIFMKSLTTVFYDKPIETIQEIVDKSFKLTGDEFALQHLINQNEVSYYQ